MEAPIELTDGRVTVRTPTTADAPAVAEAVRSTYETLAPWMPWAVESYGIDDALAWITGELDPTAVNGQFGVLAGGRLWSALVAMKSPRG